MSALPVVSIPELWKSTGDQKNDKWSIARLIDLAKYGVHDEAFEAYLDRLARK